jgi:hypothetical protein
MKLESNLKKFNLNFIKNSFWEYNNQTCQPRNDWHMDCFDTYGCKSFYGLECVKGQTLVRSGEIAGEFQLHEETTTGVTRGKQAKAGTVTTTTTTTTTITVGYCECANFTYKY